MENKSAMQQLIEWAKERAEKSKQLMLSADEYAMNDVVTKATELLEVEKKNIVEAYNEGAIPEPYNKNFDGKHYYSTKFNNQK